MSDEWTTVVSKRCHRHAHRQTDPISITNSTRRTNSPLRSRSKRGSENVDAELTPCDDDVKHITLLLAHAITQTSRNKNRRHDPITTAASCSSSSRTDARQDGAWRLFSEKNHRKFVRHVGDVAQVIVVGCTPSDYRAEKNNRARLRRADEALAQGIGGMF